MKISKQFKLEKVISTDATRSAICNALVAKHEGMTVAVATNGRSLAMVPVEIESDVELGLVSPKALTQGRKVNIPYRATESTVILNGDIKFLDGSALPRPTEQDEGAFPKWEQILPDAPVTFTVALDPRLLLAIAEAIGCEHGGIKLEFSDAPAPIRVTKCSNHADGNGAIGVLMPIR